MFYINCAGPINIQMSMVGPRLGVIGSMAANVPTHMAILMLEMKVT